MNVLLIAGLALTPIVVWLVAGGVIDRRRAAAEAHGNVYEPWYQRRRRWIIAALVLLALFGPVVSAVVALSGLIEPLEDSWLWIPIMMSLALAQVLAALGVGWLVTIAARRRLRGSAAPSSEPRLLAGRRLRATRATWLVVFGLTAAVTVVYLAGLWIEASQLAGFTGSPQEIGEPGFYRLNSATALALTAGSLTVPDWYPWLVVVRQGLVSAAALGIAWFIYSKRPRHWIALFVTLVIAVAPLVTFGDGSTVRFESVAGIGDIAALVGDALGVLTFIMFGGFLYTFPDGRFRGTYLKLLGVAAAAVLAAWLLSSGDEGWVWVTGALGALGVLGGAMASQVFRYREASPEERREARLLLASMIVLVLWLVPGQALYDAAAGMSVAAFLWQQIYLTLFLATPVLLGLWVLHLVRRQGWWDIKLFWNRAAVVAMVTPLLAVVYVAIVIATTTVSGVVFGDAGRPLAILVATSVIAVSYRPLRRSFQSWIDHRWFPTKAQADEVLASFTASVRDELTSAAVQDRLVHAVQSSIGSVDVALWIPDSTEVAR